VVNRRNLLDQQIMRHATSDAFRKLDPRIQVKNPVMFVVLIGTVVTLIDSIANPSVFAWSVTVWLALTVLFANFAEAMAEGRGKAQADTLRKTRTETDARRLVPGIGEQRVAAADLTTGDTVVVEAGDVIPSDGEITEGAASVDESAITGESAPVIRESGGDRSAVTGGTRVLSDRIVVRITAEPGQTFLDRMITWVCCVDPTESVSNRWRGLATVRGRMQARGRRGVHGRQGAHRRRCRSGRGAGSAQTRDLPRRSVLSAVASVHASGAAGL
jgi:K+-transporting ATPase ATPase B chain